MAKLQHTFVQGKMNKDLDERLIPNGQYRDAQNIQVSTSEGSDVGAVENILGNTIQNKKDATDNWDESFGLTNAKCIGTARDTQNEKIYWFFTSDEADAIIEYDQSTGFVAPVLVDLSGVLNFSDSFLITGINVLTGMLIWTDNNNEPRLINIAVFKAGSTQTSLVFTTTTQVHGRTFIASDITVLKQKPSLAPTFTAAASIRGGNGTGVTPVVTFAKFTVGVDGIQVPVLPGAVRTITTTVEPNWSTNDIIVLSTYYINSQNYKEYYEVRGTVISVTTVAGITTIIFTVIYVTTTIEPFTYEWECLLVEDEPMFNLSIPRFAYRWKYADNEYSAFSPFTEAVFVPGPYSYDPANGYNEGMENNIRVLTINGFTPDNTKVGGVVEVDILYKDSSSAVIYRVDTLPVATTTFSITSELIYNVISSEQFIRPYDNVPRKAKAQEIIGNRIVYGNYIQNYNISNPVDISVTIPATDITTLLTPEKSIKSQRSYQVGLVYLDALGRETPVFTNDGATFIVPKTNATKSTKIRVSADQPAPTSLLTHFKYYIKDISNEYYNLILDRYYDSDDGNIWLSFPSAERNKVAVDDFIILKKQHNTDIAVTDKAKYKVIDISNEAPTSVKTSRKSYTTTIVEHGAMDPASGQPGEGNVFLPIDTSIRSFNFLGPSSTDAPDFFGAFSQPKSTYVRFKSIGLAVQLITAWYEVVKGGPNGGIVVGDRQAYDLELTENILATDTWIRALLPTNTYVIEVALAEQINSPAYEGKFFVKVNRDSILEDSIIYNFTNDPADYIQVGSFLSVPQEFVNPPQNVNPPTTYYNPPPANPSTFWGWAENAAAVNPPSASTFQQPTIGLRNIGFGLAPFWTDGVLIPDQDPTGGLLNGLGYGASAGFVTNLVPGNIVQFYDSALGEWSSSLYNIKSVVTNSFTSRETGNTEPSKTFSIEFTEPFNDDLSTATAVWSRIRIMQRRRYNTLKFDEFTKVLGSPNGAIFETEPSEAIDLDLYYEASNSIPIADLAINQILDYYNCYTFGNGVESNRIRDDYNASTIGKGTKASSILIDGYEEEQRGAGLIYSGIFNSTSGVNQLNQFIAGLKITKDLNPIYGTIQKLHARDTDLVVLMEDKVFKVQADKDSLFNADGNSNVTSTNNVLGQSIPFVGEFGISKNPESFSTFGFRAYFTDKARGTVLRLSRDGLTEIADKGMSYYFKNELKNATGALIGSYDEDASSYNIAIGSSHTSFKEISDGWNTTLSYIPEAGISLNNEYYTFKNGNLYEHSNQVRSNFYGVQDSTTVTPIFNDAPTSVKNFKTLSYEGDAGWTATITTNEQSGTVSTWKKREGLYFNYIMGDATTLASIDTSDFSVQGIGQVDYSVDGVGYYDLSFDTKVNVSLQVGDVIYFQETNGGAIKQLGTCTSVSGLTIRANWDGTAANEPEDGDFILFAKDSQVNTSGLLGYYGEVVLTTTSSDKKELFAVNSEIFISSE